jgi:hypothetical protein
MNRIRKKTWRKLTESTVVALSCLILAGCATGSEVCRRDPATGAERCSTVSGNYGEAAVTATAAAASWAVVGCDVNGCEPPYRCNPETKLCERIRCGEGVGSCPAGYTCDPVKGVCL